MLRTDTRKTASAPAAVLPHPARVVRLALVASLLVLLVLAASPARATTLVELSVEEMAAMADTIVVARTTQVSARPGFSERSRAALDTIETDVGLEVSRVMKGRAADARALTLPGGTVGDRRLEVGWVPAFEPGETSILFLDEEGRVIGGPQGKLDVRDGRVPSLDQSLDTVLARIGGAPVLGPASSATTGIGAERVSMRLPEGVAVAAPDATAASGFDLAATTLVFYDGFEGANPGWWTWRPDYLDPPTNTVPAAAVDWDYSTYRASAGTYSMYCVESPTVAPGPYSNDMESWLGIGPFDLSDATNAFMDYDLWLDSVWSSDGNPDNDDWFNVLFSTDNVWYDGFRYAGNSSGWMDDSVDLSDVFGDGTFDLTGESQVWFSFVFESDGSLTDEGAYVDEVSIVKNLTTPVISDITPDTGSAGTETQVTITGSNFGSIQGAGRVEFYYRAGTPIEAAATSWSDTRIICDIPIDLVAGYPASAGTGPVNVVNAGGARSNDYAFTVTFGYGGYAWPSLGITYTLNANCADLANEEALVDAATATWNSASIFGFNDGGAGSGTDFVANGENEVFWSSSALPPGALAAAGIWYLLDGNPETIDEVDLCFNDQYDWADGAVPFDYDVQSTALHEFGHWLNLRDLYGAGDSAKSMYGYGSSGTTKRVLDTQDERGAQYIYHASRSRVSGGNRYSTACAIASAHFASADVTTVVVATGEQFPDALSAAGLAGVYGAPLLLVNTDSVPASVDAQLTAYTSLQKIVIVGGPAAVDSDVETALGAYATVQRISGSNRYRTAAEVAEEIQLLQGAGFTPYAFFARGDVFADALAVAPFAYTQRVPVLLTETDLLPGPTSDVITALGITDGTVAGGTAAVDDTVKGQIDALLTANAGVPVTTARWWGANRYATAAAIAANGVAQFAENDYSFIGFATGENFPDALAGGVACGEEGGVLLLTRTAYLSSEAEAAVGAGADQTLDIELFGGTTALADHVDTDIEDSYK